MTDLCIQNVRTIYDLPFIYLQCMGVYLSCAQSLHCCARREGTVHHIHITKLKGASICTMNESQWNQRRGKVNSKAYSLEICLFAFLMSSSTTRLYCGRAPRQSVWQFYVLPHMRQSWETMASVSAGHINDYTDTDPTSRERAATAGVEPGTSSPGVACSTDWANTPPTH